MKILRIILTMAYIAGVAIGVSSCKKNDNKPVTVEETPASESRTERTKRLLSEKTFTIVQGNYLDTNNIKSYDTTGIKCFFFDEWNVSSEMNASILPKIYYACGSYNYSEPCTYSKSQSGPLVNITLSVDGEWISLSNSDVFNKQRVSPFSVVQGNKFKFVETDPSGIGNCALIQYLGFGTGLKRVWSIKK